MASVESTEFSASQRADLFLKLSERARARLESRRAIDWRVLLGLWSALAIAAGIVITTGQWVPGGVEATVGALIALAAFLWHVLAWVPRVNRDSLRDSRVAYYWETHVLKLLGAQPPAGLSPEPRHAPWPTAFEEAAVFELPTGWRSWHDAHRGKVFVTLVFAILFAGAIVSKWNRGIPGAPSSRLTIEGASFELSKIKAGR